MTDLVVDLKKLYGLSTSWDGVVGGIQPVEQAGSTLTNDPFSGMDGWLLDGFLVAYRNFTYSYFAALTGAKIYAGQLGTTLKEAAFKYADQEGVNQASFID